MLDMGRIAGWAALRLVRAVFLAARSTICPLRIAGIRFRISRRILGRLVRLFPVLLLWLLRLHLLLDLRDLDALVDDDGIWRSGFWLRCCCLCLCLRTVIRRLLVLRHVVVDLDVDGMALGGDGLEEARRGHEHQDDEVDAKGDAPAGRVLFIFSKHPPPHFPPASAASPKRLIPALRK